ncbi:MAG: dihydrolipoamide acetyltransferase family protein, partial [Anaerolineae bacterium]|nr:dihydrolipoamide acetyltransferase family protein [Anaerolineae bacterium]
MATAIVMPKQGQSVESCIIVGWKKAVGDPIDEGEILCEVETDKALLEVESTTAGTVLALFFAEGDEVPVLTPIAAVGEAGEAFDHLAPAGASPATTAADPAPEASTPPVANGSPVVTQPDNESGLTAVSPRARNLARQKNVDLAVVRGTGPAGRIIERDVQAVLAQQPLLTPLARSMVEQGGFTAPATGSGVRGRVLAGDLIAESTGPAAVPAADALLEAEVVPVRGIRKVIASRMLESLQTTAQLTLNATADARALLAYRQRLKTSDESLGLQAVTINDLLLFVVSRLLPQHPALNAHFNGDHIRQYRAVNLGFAVDTARGLLVPV